MKYSELPSKYTSRLGAFTAGLWVRRVAVLLLAAILAGNLGVMTFAWSQHPAAGGGGFLGVLWVLSLAGFFVLFRLWQAPSGAPPPSGQAAPSNHHWKDRDSE
jgi:hypothetical protein